MIGYVMLGTGDLLQAKRFYEPLFELMGLLPCYADKQVVSWGDSTDDNVPRFFIGYPYDENPASVGNGNMVAFRLGSAAKVDMLYQTAMDLGATDEGKPGFRPEVYGDRFYVAYVRDLDGNKLAFTCYDGKANP